LCICGSEGPAHWPRFLTRSWCDCQSHLAVSQETWVRNGRLNLAYGHYWFFFMPEGSFTCRKSTTWDWRLYFPSEGSGASDFYHPQKIHRPRSGSNPRTLGPVASTLTTSPPRSTCFI
jgi:hypothetical protein